MVDQDFFRKEYARESRRSIALRDVSSRRQMEADMSGEQTQIEAILALLKKVPSGITAMDALRVCGCFRLAARIYDLQNAGYWIEAEMVEVPSHKRVARYRLLGVPTKGGNGEMLF
jgi:hypothetical protein